MNAGLAGFVRVIVRLRSALLAVAAAAALAACAIPGLMGETPAAPVAAAEADAGYRIGPEDVLEISVWKEEGLKKEVLVRPDGAISFPLAGDLQVAGKTAEQVRNEITERLRSTIMEPAVSVSVLRVASNKIFVIGRVNKPGDFVAGRYIDVLQALSMAGGLTPFAAENDIKILRRDQGREQQVMPFRFGDVRKGQNLEQNITLRNGDVVLVP